MKQAECLLNKVSEIINTFEEKRNRCIQCGEDTGSLFNIFEILSIGTREVYMCRVLAELLNRNGLHCQGTKYLDLFCRRFLYEQKIKTKNALFVIFHPEIIITQNGVWIICAVRTAEAFTQFVMTVLRRIIRICQN